ncbi:MAG: hypothetical protein WCV56_01220 [Candidatus Omnitrophota bacterium]
MGWKMFSQVVLLLLLIGFMLLAIGERVVPKYKLYVSEDGTVTYRLNIVRGIIESDTYGNGDWKQTLPISPLKRIPEAK